MLVIWKIPAHQDVIANITCRRDCLRSTFIKPVMLRARSVFAGLVGTLKNDCDCRQLTKKTNECLFHYFSLSVEVFLSVDHYFTQAGRFIKDNRC